MTHGWIIDVLTDLQAYALVNGLTALAADLDQVKLGAQAEILAANEAGGLAVASGLLVTRTLSGAGGTGPRA